ncbi:MAG: NAD(P)H-dependent glycerol-3-phosphate dehydrogenase [Opitutales bacterium]
MNFLVIGAGAWGTAFAVHLARAGRPVTLAPRRPEHAAALQARRQNADYLPGVALPPNLAVTAELATGLAQAEVVLLACPSQALRETCGRLRAALPASSRVCLVLNLAKGLELHTHLRPAEVMAGVLPGRLVGSLTGPTNAEEVARGMPAAMVLAATRQDACLLAAQTAMSSPTLRVYTSEDLAGVEFGGSLKNIYAIAAGCCDGLKLGDNAKAALLTRALAEMVRVGTALGAQAETFYGLSGFGDLVATCHGAWSRNREFGRRIGEGARAADLISHRKTVVEGYLTTQAFSELCGTRGIDAPILLQMNAILFAGKAPAAALSALMSRGLKSETPAPAPAA